MEVGGKEQSLRLIYVKRLSHGTEQWEKRFWKTFWQILRSWPGQHTR